MRKTEVFFISNPGRVFDFVSRRYPMNAVAEMKGLGLEVNGELQVGVVYENYNGHNVWMHVAKDPAARLRPKVTMEFIEYCFEYPFIEMGCDRVSGYVEASNAEAVALDEHLGFKTEAVLRGAASDGGDVILMVMWRKDCRFLKENRHG